MCTQKPTEVSFIYPWNQKLKKWKRKKLTCSEVSVNSLGIRGVSPEEEKEGYGGKDLQKTKVLSLE